MTEPAKTILLVEDEAIIAMAEKLTLKDRGYEVLVAHSGEKAVEMAAAADRLDLVLMDIDLGGGIDGTEAARQILKIRDLPIVFLTSHAEREMVEKVRHITRHGYVIKNSGDFVLLSSIEMAFELYNSFQQARESEKRYRDLIEFLPLAVFVDRGGRIEFVNTQCLRLLGAASPEEIIGRSPFDIIHPDDHGMVRELIRRMVEEGENSGSVEERVVRLDGSVVDVEVTATPLLDRGTWAVQVIMQDVTEKKLAGDILKARLRISEYADSHGIDDLLQMTLDEAEKLTGSTIGFFHFLDIDQQTLMLQTWSSRTLSEMCGAEGKGQHYPVEQAGVWVDCVRERRPVIHNDYQSLPHKKGMPEGHAPVVREMVIPITRENLIVAILGVGNRASDYTEREVAVAAQLAEYAWDIVLRRRAEESLRESEDRYRTLIQSSPESVLVVSDGIIEFANSACMRLLGHDSNDGLVGRPLLDLIDPDEHVAVQAGIDGAKAGAKVDFIEQKWRKRDGTVVEVETGVVSFVYHGRPALQVIARDISETKRIQYALHENLEKYRVLFESFPQGITITDRHGNIMETNRRAEEILGVPEHEHRSRTIDGPQWGIVSPEGLPLPPDNFTSIRALRENRLIANEEMGIVRENGEITWISVTAAPIPLEEFGVAITYSDITERRKISDDLLRSEGRYREIIELSHDLIQRIAVDGRFLFVNKAWLTVLGYKSDDLTSLTVWDVVHPDLLQKCRDEFEKVAKNGEALTVETVFLSTGGEAVFVEGMVVPQVEKNIIVSFNCFFHDITEKYIKERSNAIRLIATQILATADSVAGAVNGLLRGICETSDWMTGELWRIDGAGERLVLGGEWCRENDDELMGFRRISVDVTFKYGYGIPGQVWKQKRAMWRTRLGRDHDFVRDSLAERVGLAAAMAVPVMSGEEVLGVLMFFSRTARPPEKDLIETLSDTGRYLGQFIARKELEAQLEKERLSLAHRVEERTAELRVATVQAQAANKAKSDFLAAMSHELRTPLNSIIGFSEIMLGGMAGTMSNEQREYLNDIYESGRHLLSVINDILDLSKIEAGKMDLEKTTVSVESVLNAAAALFREKALKHGIRLSVHSRLSGEDDIIVADERKLKQILFNLIGNAVKFTPDGGAVSVEAEKYGEAGAGVVLFSVKDSGIGIAREDLDKLFKPFQQIDSTSTRPHEGTGLGLSISRSFVKMHGGDIWAESSAGAGSLFRFTIGSAKGGGHG